MAGGFLNGDVPKARLTSPAELPPHPLQIYDSFTLHRIIMCYYNSNK